MLPLAIAIPIAVSLCATITALWAWGNAASKALLDEKEKRVSEARADTALLVKTSALLASAAEVIRLATRPKSTPPVANAEPARNPLTNT